MSKDTSGPALIVIGIFMMALAPILGAIAQKCADSKPVKPATAYPWHTPYPTTKGIKR